MALASCNWINLCKILLLVQLPKLLSLLSKTWNHPLRLTSLSYRGEDFLTTHNCGKVCWRSVHLHFYLQIFICSCVIVLICFFFLGYTTTFSTTVIQECVICISSNWHNQVYINFLCVSPKLFSLDVLNVSSLYWFMSILFLTLYPCHVHLIPQIRNGACYELYREFDKGPTFWYDHNVSALQWYNWYAICCLFLIYNKIKMQDCEYPSERLLDHPPALITVCHFLFCMHLSGN